MAEFKGSEVVVEFAGTDISGSARTVTVSEAPGELEKIDVTVKGDTARQYLASFPGGNNTTVTMEVLANAASDPIEAIAANTSGSMVVLPEGDTQGAISVTVAAMYLIGKDYSIPYADAVKWDLSFNSTTAAVYGTNAT